MRVVWSDDDAVPRAMREAIARGPGNNARVIVILERGNATESEINDAIRTLLNDAWFGLPPRTDA